MSAIKLVTEVALMALVGRWLLGLLAGAGRQGNLFYRLLDTLAMPFIRAARHLAPARVLDRHLPLVAGLLLGFAWFAALLGKIGVCLSLGMAVCR